MSTRLAAVPPGDRRPAGPVHRSIVAVDLEGSTMRTNLVKGVVRRAMYEMAEKALDTSGITSDNLEPFIDRGDGVLILVRPHDDVPKTVLLDRLIPALTALLSEHNAAAAQPALRIRLRAVVHAGEVHEDDRGFYGCAIDVAIRLLDSQALKNTLKQATATPLALVISEEIHWGIVCQGYVDGAAYRPLGRVRVGHRLYRGWVHIPEPGECAGLETVDSPGRVIRSPALAIARERVERIIPAFTGSGSRLSGRRPPGGGHRPG